MSMGILSFVTVTSFFGIVIWFWGGLSFFNEPAHTAVVIITCIFVIASFFTKLSGFHAGKKEDKSNRWIFIPFAILTLALFSLTTWSDKHNWMTIDGSVTRTIGLVLYTFGAILRIYPVFVLGRRFSPIVAIQQNHVLETSGIYKIIRHPSYLGLLINLIGWSLIFRSIIGVCIAFLYLIPLIARMNAEEKLLAEEFTEAYVDYRRHTWRLIPFIY